MIEKPEENKLQHKTEGGKSAAEKKAVLPQNSSSIFKFRQYKYRTRRDPGHGAILRTIKQGIACWAPGSVVPIRPSIWTGRLVIVLASRTEPWEHFPWLQIFLWGLEGQGVLTFLSLKREKVVLHNSHAG